MPPMKRYFVVAKIGVRDVPVSLGYHRAYTEQGAINEARNMPFAKEVFINSISAEQR